MLNTLNYNGRVVTRQIFNSMDKLFYSWLLCEVYYTSPITNYEKFKGLFGIQLPRNKSKNSWRTIYLKWFKKIFVVRWTLK